MKRRSMTPSRVAVRLAALTVLLLTATVSNTAAYVLEGPHILDLTADAMGRIAALKVEQKVMVFAEAEETPPTVFEETAIYVMPERFRSDIVSDRIQRTHLEFANSSLTVVNGQRATATDPFDQYQRLLRSRTRQHLMRTLSGLGVEIAISSLGRVGEQVVYVVGAHYPDESVAQLAVDKATFLPVRLLLTPDGQQLAIVYHDWQQLKDGWFPYQIDFSMGDRLIRQIQVTDIQLNPSIPASLMDLEALGATIGTQNEIPGDDADDAVETVQKVVQDFQKKFE